MSKITLPDGCAVEAKDIAEIKAEYASGLFSVRMRNGIGHHKVEEDRYSFAQMVENFAYNLARILNDPDDYCK